jgi:mannobiose 2-epimerase
MFDRKAHDDEHGSYLEVLSSDWQQALAGDRFFGAPGGKHLHAQVALLQGFTELYAATGESGVRDRLEEILQLILDKLIDAELGYARIHMSDAWQPLPPQLSSYGHDIEFSWLLDAAARTLGRPEDPRTRRAVLALAEHTLRHGLDRAGGIFWEGPPGAAPRNRHKVWWPQAEALVGFLNAYERTGDDRYREAFERQAAYVWRRCIDHRHGEWFDGDGALRRMLAPKASQWHEPYHQGRACLEVVRRMGSLDDRESPPVRL